MKKTFVLDTNVLLHDPRAMFSFDDNNVVIPIYVVEEIDNFKKELSELGQNARQVSRYLDDLRQESSLMEGVKLDKGGVLRIAISSRVIPLEISLAHNHDERIMAVAMDVSEQVGKELAVFITKDTNLRIRADAIGLKTEDYEPEFCSVEDQYTGCHTFNVSAEEIDTFHSRRSVELPDPYLSPNEYIEFVDGDNPSHTALARTNLQDKVAMPIPSLGKACWGIKARNKEQIFALDLLLDDSIQLVTLVGKAGTGKTLIAIAAGLQKVAEERTFQRLLVSRPIFPLGRDIGFLPGDIEEKLNPWMQPIFDNVEFLMGISQDGRKSRRNYRELIEMGIMQIEPLTYIRGRSIASQFMIVDEAQNLTPHEVKTIISRAGEGTKIILTGDPNQIDNPYVDATNNGLMHVVNRFKSERLAGHIKLTKGERSGLAELAANIL